MSPTAGKSSALEIILKRLEKLEHCFQEMHAEVTVTSETISTLMHLMTTTVDGEQCSPRARSEHTDRRTTLRSEPARVSLSFTTAHQSAFEPVVGWVINHSFRGIALLTEMIVTADSFLTLQASSATSRHATVEVQVRYRMREGKFWRLGCQLLVPLRETEWQEFLGLEAVSEQQSDLA